MFKKIDVKALAAIGMVSTAVSASERAMEEFENDWENPAYTQIKLEDVDVNHVLSTYYKTSEPVHFTREMLWDVERKKAWDPMTYIPHVVRDGKSWGRMFLENGDESFTRASQQRQWLTGEHAKVFEEVLLMNGAQKAIFIGVSNVLEEDGEMAQTQNPQPLFHVEHGVGGEEDRPLNTWRIVHLTQGKDENLIERFANFRDSTILPKYIEVYIEKDLNVRVQRKEG